MTRFERRLYIGFAILVLLFTPVLVGSFIVISQLETTQGEMLSKNATDVIEAERLSSLINQEFALVQSFVLRVQSGQIAQLASVHHDFQATATSLLLGLEINETPAVLNETRQLENDMYDAIKEAADMKAHGASTADLSTFLETKNITRGARVLQLVRQEVEVQTQQLHEARTYVDRTAKRLVWGLILACAFALVASAAVIVLLYQMLRNKVNEDKRRDEKLKLELDLSNARKEAVEVVAHDLKNPLSSMKMSLELLQDELANDPREDVAMGFEIAKRSISSMQRLIDDQLDHTKIESGQLVLDKRLANVTELLRDAEMRFRPLMEGKGITFASSIDRALYAELDVSRMEQVLSNLLGNALKFTPTGGLVQLNGTRRDGYIIMCVKDTGPGLSQDALGHIFERYWQVKEQAKKGTGLGLAIAKGIVEAHGGDLKASSEVGRGSEFTVKVRAATLSRSPEVNH